MQAVAITDQEFARFRQLIYDIAGISMSPAKKSLVAGRLAKRLAHYGVASYEEYFAIVQDEASHQELQVAVDLLTTNETFFFREPKHFDFLRDQVLACRASDRLFRVWSAACSSGEEAYTLAMVLADTLGEQADWEVVASDISSRVLLKARTGHYPLQRNHGISRQHLRRYCLKGVGAQAGTFLINPNLRRRVAFRQINLNETLPQLGEFDVIFLRNVMIYFNSDTKANVVRRLVPLLRPGGYFIVSHSESLNGITSRLELVIPSIYRKAGA